MKIRQFIEKFTINPIEDIEPFFRLNKTLNVDATCNKGCFNCADPVNQASLMCVSWQAVQYCWICNHLNVVYYKDRMSPWYTNDVVKCYGEE